MPPKVIDKDHGYKALTKRMKKHRRGPYVTVGIQGTEAAQKRKFGETNVTLAAVHEFGSRDGRIPQRSFIRSTVERERELIYRMLETAVRRIAADGDAARHMGIVGLRARTEMVRTIDQTIGLQPLAQSTIDQKGSTRPLIDTGQLKNAITWKVHNV